MPRVCGGDGRSPSSGIASSEAKAGVSDSSGTVTESGEIRIPSRYRRLAATLTATQATTGTKYPVRGQDVPAIAIQAAKSGTTPTVSRNTSATGETFATRSLRNRSTPAQPRLQATTRRRTESGRDMGGGVYIESLSARPEPHPWPLSHRPPTDRERGPWRGRGRESKPLHHPPRLLFCLPDVPGPSLLSSPPPSCSPRAPPPPRHSKPSPRSPRA